MSLDIVAVTDIAAIAQVARLAHRIWNEHFPPIIGQAQVDYMVVRFQSTSAITQQLAEGMQYYVLTVDGQDAGYFGVKPETETRLFLSKLYILAAYRGQGLGRRALLFIEDLAREASCSSITLTCNKGNTSTIAAYEHLGFEHTGTLVKDIGAGFVMDDVTMAKPVTSPPPTESA